MATIKLKFRPSSVKGAEGTLYYQVIHKRNVMWASTGYHVYPEEWDDKNGALLLNPDGERRANLRLMQSEIEWELRLRRQVIYRFETADRDFSFDELRDAISRLPRCRTVFCFLQEQVARQERMMRQGTARTYSNAYRRFRDFRGGIDLAFDELTPGMIEEYEA